MQLWYCVIGILLVALALIGAFLPLLPTTPFLILAAMCFTRGSDRLYRWLVNHKILGPYLNDWEKYRIVPIRAKLLAVSMISFSAALIIVRYELHLLAAVALVILLMAVCVYICSFPSDYKKPLVPHQKQAPEKL